MQEGGVRVSDKLVYALVALESIFLRNHSEPIQKNLGERIAFLVGDDRDSRKAIVALIGEIYGIRSALLHHGKDVSSSETKVIEFFHIAWNALHAVIQNADRFDSIDLLMSAHDDRKMSSFGITG